MDLKKGILSGIVAAIVLIILGFVFGMLYPTYNEWYMTIFAEMNMTMMWIATLWLGIFMGIIYSVVESTVPGTGYKKGLNYGVMVWLLSGIMWPVMAIGYAPISITGYDLISGLIMYVIAGIALAAAYNKF